MTRADLLALAARVEAAQGADRELEEAIWRLVVRPDAPANRAPLPWLHCYSTSLDAAASLVPARPYYTCVETIPWTGVLLHRAWCCVRFKTRHPQAIAATPALALTAAALRAMAEEATDGPD